MKVKQHGDFVEIEVIERIPEGQPCSGDAKLQICARVTGMESEFVGQTTCWVSLESLKSFCQGLNNLEKTRKGSSSIGSMSPNEFEFRVRATDGWGHIEVSGHIGHPGVSRGVLGESLISFAIPLDPTDLPEVAQGFSGLLAKPYGGWLKPESV